MENVKKSNKKSLFKKVILGLTACLVAVFSVIAILPSEKIDFVSADMVSSNYEYVGNELFYLTGYVVKNGSNDPQLKTIVFDLTLSYGKLNEDYIALYTNAYIFDNNSFDQSPYSLYFSNWDNESRSIPQITADSIDRKKLRFEPAGEPYWIPVYFKTIGNFNCDVVSVKLETIPSNATNAIYSDWPYFLDDDSNIIQLTYTDSLNNLFLFQFFTSSSVNLTSRTYYISPDFSDNQIYNQGYQDGLLDNQENIYSNGYDAGLIEGFDNGYNSGINASNQYSFYNLFGAVIDAPVKVFSGLFNFNLLGINLFGLITGLLTLAMVILVLKLIFGGR